MNELALAGWRVPQKAGPPELSFFSFDPFDLLQNVRVDFPDLEKRQIQLFIRRQETLACVGSAVHSSDIWLHSVLNHADTPREVVTFILRHELLHVRIPSRECEGVLTAHPPEFWEAERQLAPEREKAWCWLYGELGEILRINNERECVLVKRGWRRSMRRRRQSWGDMSAIFTDMAWSSSSVTDGQDSALPL